MCDMQPSTHPPTNESSSRRVSMLSSQAVSTSDGENEILPLTQTTPEKSNVSKTRESGEKESQSADHRAGR